MPGHTVQSGERTVSAQELGLGGARVVSGSALRFVVHAAAPCPPQTKQAMIDWWGPVIHEYYGSTEVGPVTFLTAEYWVQHPGSVGKPMEGAQVRVIDEAGRVLGVGERGEVVARGTTGDNDFKLRDPFWAEAGRSI
jgi:acyl-coenzyme A synthetase/AMP-(fatty) acid ligase